jgi:succinate dehydrogenase/fumarate reductase flavoprotein subunit
VFAERIGADLARALPPPSGAPGLDPRPHLLYDAAIREHVATAMTDGAGVLRSRDSLGRTLGRLVELRLLTAAEPSTAAWEATNLHTVATFVAAAARDREETRGSHWREDFPERDDAAWGGHLVGALEPAEGGGSVALTYAAMQPADRTGDVIGTEESA